jgi:MORN repeat variant
MINSKTKFRSFIIVVAMPGFFVAACGGGGNYKIVEVPNGKGVMQRFYPGGKIRYEAEVNIIPDDKIGKDSTSREKYVMNGFRKEYFANGKMSILSFMKNGAEDHHRNTYTYYENGQLKAVASDSFSVVIQEIRGLPFCSNNGLLDGHMDHINGKDTANIANMLRVFSKVEGLLHIKICETARMPCFDTAVRIGPKPGSRTPWNNTMYSLRFPHSGNFVYFAEYTLTDSLSGIKVITDTMIFK